MIDINKKYRTRDGREVRIYAVDCGREKNIAHGAVRNKDADWWGQCSWHQNGKFFDGPHDHKLDLIEVRPRHKRTVWLNVYEGDIIGPPCPSKDQAERVSACISRRSACIKVELGFEEGEGL